MGYGCWSKGGRLLKWLRLWSESLIPLESGAVEAMEIAGNSNALTSTAFLQQLPENHPGPLVVIWDNSPAHRGEAIRSYLATPDLPLRLVALPAYSPDFNADEAVWDWVVQRVVRSQIVARSSQPSMGMVYIRRLSTMKNGILRNDHILPGSFGPNQDCIDPITMLCHDVC